ncbi:MAG: hypothetical protein H3Z54_10115, partial [archaeon]|nr:hypothetical protein [archaeon]
MRLILDPVFGPFDIQPEEESLLSEQPVRRLNHIRQLGLVYINFPGATHSKYAHTLGVLRLAKEAIASLKLEESDAKLLRSFAILHCTGHGPFSWASENYFRLNGGLNVGKRNVHIVDMESMKRILEDSWHFNKGEIDLLKESVSRGEQLTVPPDKKYLEETMYLLLRLEFLARDSYYTGVQAGRVDPFRIILSASVDPATKHLLFRLGSMQFVESVFISFYLMYLHVYSGGPRPVIDAMFRKALEIAVARYKSGKTMKFVEGILFGLGEDPDPTKFLSLTDDFLLSSLLQCEDQAVSEIVKRLTIPLPYEHICSKELDDSQKEKYKVSKNLKQLEDKLAEKAVANGMPEYSVLVAAPRLDISRSISEFETKIKDIFVEDEMGAAVKVFSSSPLIPPF